MGLWYRVFGGSAAPERADAAAAPAPEPPRLHVCEPDSPAAQSPAAPLDEPPGPR